MQPIREKDIQKLPCYDRNGPFEHYLAQVRLAVQLNGWSHKETAGHLVMSLGGPEGPYKPFSREAGRVQCPDYHTAAAVYSATVCREEGLSG